MSGITLLIADNHAYFRDSLRRLCEVNGGFTILAEAETGRQAISLARQLQPDVILMDAQMPDLTGLEATRRIVAENPRARVLILTLFAPEQLSADARQAGASGYLAKDCDEDALFAAIHAASAGADGTPDPTCQGRWVA